MTLEQKDDLLLRRLPPDDWAAIVDLARSGLRVGTIRGSLKRLLDAGTIERRWDGNERFGRYIYRVKQ